SYYDRVFLQRLNLWKINDTIKKYFLNPDLGEMLCKLAGIDGIRIWHDQTLQKQPWANPTAWHLDNPYWSFHSPNALSIWIALDDATKQNGCLYYLPGTHKTATYENVEIGKDIAALFEVYPEWKKIEPFAAEMKAGWARVHNGLSAHGAGPNMTPYPRRAMTCAYMPDGACFNGQQNILSKEYFESLKIGDLLNNEEQNPLLWSRSLTR
ncbi:MAG: phytanoyl-CoA dioxygenase family protein, partial [bacterium]